MRNATPFIDRNLRRGDLNLLVNLNRIAINDLTADFERDLNSQFRFTRRSRANDGDDVAQIVNLRSIGFVF